MIKICRKLCMYSLMVVIFFVFDTLNSKPKLISLADEIAIVIIDYDQERDKEVIAVPDKDCMPLKSSIKSGYKKEVLRIEDYHDEKIVRAAARMRADEDGRIERNAKIHRDLQVKREFDELQRANQNVCCSIS